MKILETKLDGSGLKIAIIQSRFNGFISDALLSGAEEGLVRHGVESDAITVFKVPGSLEIPLVLKRVAASGAFDGAICLGAVIKGDTAHFDLEKECKTNSLSLCNLLFIRDGLVTFL